MPVGKSRGLGVISNRMSSISERKAAEHPLLYLFASFRVERPPELFFCNEPSRNLGKQRVALHIYFF